MGFSYEERASDSPYVVGYAYVRAETNIQPLCRAESRWELVIQKHEGLTSLKLGGPTTKATLLEYPEGSEFLVIKFKIGTFMPHLRIGNFVDVETHLPGAASQSFWLNGAAWQFPDYENVDTFIHRLVRQEILVRDSVIPAVLDHHKRDESSPRTLRRRFLRSTGLNESAVRQIDRALFAASLLERGFSILDTVEQAGYADQPHLTRALKRFIGQTPAQLITKSE